MLDFTYNWKTKIYFGKHSIEQIGNILNERNVKKVLIMHDSGPYLESEILMPTIRAKLDTCSISYYEEGSVKPNPSLENINNVIDKYKNEKIDLVLGVGGGSVIDSAKMVALGLSDKINLMQMFNGEKNAQSALPIGVVLTIASAGSETSNAAIINIDEERKRAINSELIIPDFAILNPELTYSLPVYQTACGASDIIMHTFERYFSPSSNTYLTDSMSVGLIQSVMKALHIVLEDPNNYDARSVLMWAGTISHNGIFGTGKIEDWGAHMLGHEIGGFYNVAHGATLCSIWSSWARYVSKTNPERFYQFATQAMSIPEDRFNEEFVIEQGIKEFECFLKGVGMPINLVDLNLNLTDVDLQKMSRSALEGKEFIGNIFKIKYNDALSIYRLANNKQGDVV